MCVCVYRGTVIAVCVSMYIAVCGVEKWVGENVG